MTSSLVEANNLPEFKSPPVVEVALDVSFTKLLQLRSFEIASFWGKLKNGFPRFEEMPIQPIVVESFGKHLLPQIQFEISHLPPVPRFFFLNQPGTELLQVQQDLFGHNWRKVGSGDAYPRYERIREQFRENLEVFCSFLEENNLGTVTPQQCEISYVNHIEAGKGWTEVSEIGNVFAMHNVSYSDSFLGSVETVSFAETHVMKKESLVARLRISVETLKQATSQKPIFKLTLTARGKPDSDDINGVLSFLDFGRELIVRGFCSVTQPMMHQIWERVK